MCIRDRWLINQGVKTIFYPSVFYEHQEDPGAQNHFNCPMVIANPENIANNVEDIDGVRFLKPFLALTSEKVAADRLAHFFEDSFGIAPLCAHILLGAQLLRPGRVNGLAGFAGSDAKAVLEEARQPVGCHLFAGQGQEGLEAVSYTHLDVYKRQV